MQSSRASPDIFTPLTEPYWKKCPWKNFEWSGNPSRSPRGCRCSPVRHGGWHSGV